MLLAGEKHVEETLVGDNTSNFRVRQLMFSLFPEDDFPLFPVIASLSPQPSAQKPLVHSALTSDKDGIHNLHPNYTLIKVRSNYPEPNSNVEFERCRLEGSNMRHLHISRTWDIVPQPSDIKLVGCKSIFKTKFCF